MRFVAEITESASHGTPLTADTLRRFSSAAMPYGDIPARLSSAARKFRNGATVVAAVFILVQLGSRTFGQCGPKGRDILAQANGLG